ncbi:MAG: autotransporter domain-containing protein [Pseudomonadales bacterium]
MDQKIHSNRPHYLGTSGLGAYSALVRFFLRSFFACVLLLSHAALAGPVNVTINGVGSVVSDQEGIDCPANECGADFFGPISLTATPGAGQVFSNWIGDCTEPVIGNVCDVNADESQTAFSITAVFTVFIEQDTDNDGVADGLDQCPNTPNGEPVDIEGCGASQLDDDEDGVTNDLDQCPNTPFAADVNAQGCAASQLDDDNDGVSNDIDQCPNTEISAVVDAQGCAAAQLDDDNDGVNNDIDQCPNTAANAIVDAQGCANAQLDDDNDGVNNSIDLCPNTAANARVDANGCSDAQNITDTDADGVDDANDQCPNTAANAAVDANGCSAAQNAIDTDEDGIDDPNDQCPNTPAGEQVDANGCSASQLDTDGDGTPDNVDTCANTDPDLPINAEGCNEVQQFGTDLQELPGLAPAEQELGSTIDELCPRLVELDNQGDLTPSVRALREACSSIKNGDTSNEQAAAALQEIALTEIASQKDYVLEMATTQLGNLNTRFDQIRQGGGRGVSISGLNIRSGGKAIPMHVVQSAFENLLGMGASADTDGEPKTGVDFGKMGIFIQGDFEFGERDQTTLESGYDFDSWNFSMGADYRFSDTVFGGASVSYGKVDIEFAENGGKSDISNWGLSLFGGWQITNEWFVDTILSYGTSDFETTRHIAYTDINGLFESDQLGVTDGSQVFVGVNTGYMLNKNAWRFGPTLSLAYVDGSIDGFTETAVGDNSSDAWNFIVDKQNYESLRLSLGVQADYAINTSIGVLIPGFRAAFVKESEDNADSVNTRLANNPFGDDALNSNQVAIITDGQDSSYLDFSANVSGQFILGISGFVRYGFYTSYDNFSREGVSVGLRWDKPW